MEDNEEFTVHVNRQRNEPEKEEKKEPSEIMKRFKLCNDKVGQIIIIPHAGKPLK